MLASALNVRDLDSDPMLSLLMFPLDSAVSLSRHLTPRSPPDVSDSLPNMIDKVCVWGVGTGGGSYIWSV